MQGGAGHLGDVLPADRKSDLDAPFDLAAGLLRQPQQRMGDALLDLFAGHLDHAGMRVLQAVTDGLQCAGCDRGNCATSRDHEVEGQASETLSTAATAVAG